jgi:hypothetical protein
VYLPNYLEFLSRDSGNESRRGLWSIYLYHIISLLCSVNFVLLLQLGIPRHPWSDKKLYWPNYLGLFIRIKEAMYYVMSLFIIGLGDPH